MKPYENTYTSAPYIRTEKRSEHIINDFFLALCIVFLGSIYFFGYAPIIIVGTAFLTGYLCAFVLKFFRNNFYFNSNAWKSTVLVYALMLPANTPYYIVIFGVLMIFLVAKTVFCINNQDVFNPALIGRISVMIFFPNKILDQNIITIQKLFPIVSEYNTQYNNSSIIKSFIDSCNIITGYVPINDTILEHITKYHSSTLTPTELWQQIKYSNYHINWNIWEYLTSIKSDSLGEVSIIVLLFAFLWLVIRGTVKPMIPILYIASFSIWIFIFGGLTHNKGLFYIPSLSLILEGSLFYSAIFLLTDYASSPIRYKARLISAGLGGIIAASFQLWSFYPDIHMITILILNSMNELIDISVKNTIFGIVSEVKKPYQWGVFPKSKEIAIKVILGCIIMGVSYSGSTLILSETINKKASNVIIDNIKDIFPGYTSIEYATPNIYIMNDISGNHAVAVFSSAEGLHSPIKLILNIQEDMLKDIKILSIGQDISGIGTSINDDNWIKPFENQEISELSNIIKEFELQNINITSRKQISLLKILKVIENGVLEYQEYIQGATNESII